MKKFFLVTILLGISSGIFILNALCILPWFLGDSPSNLTSIEVSYVSMGRFLVEHFPHLSWAPYWYLGFPFHLFYTPFLPISEAILHKILPLISLWQAYRIITGLAFCLAPVTLFLFVWYLTKRPLTSAFSSLLYSFGPTVFYFVLSTGEVAADRISSNFWDPRRFVILQRWGEGPHLVSLVFLPLAGLLYVKALKTKTFLSCLLTAIFVALTALTNAVGFYGLAILLLVIFFSDLTQKDANFEEKIKVSMATAFLSFGLVSFWYNLSFIGSFFREGGEVFKNYLSLFPWGFILGLWVVVGIYFIFQKLVKSLVLKVGLLWFAVMFLIVFIYYTSSPPELSELRLEFAPQALRLLTEADMGFSILAGAMLFSLFHWVEKKGRVFKFSTTFLELVLICGLLLYSRPFFPIAQKAAQPTVDLGETAEYEIATLLKDRVDGKKGERVFLAGNYAFYLNYFTDVWQLRGGLYQAMTHPWPEHVYYQVRFGKDPEITKAWLAAINTKYIVVNTGASREFFKEYKVLDKFGIFKSIYEENGDIIYKIPLSNDSPVKIVDLASLARLESPQKADDKKPLMAYAEWLDQKDSSGVVFRMENHNLYKILAQVREGEGVLVQMTYDPGFKAIAFGRRIKITKDPLGFMILIFPKPGGYEVLLKHSPTFKIYFGYLLTSFTIILLAYVLVKKGNFKISKNIITQKSEDEED